ncbi:hypothetical protein [Anaerovibrio lipolyticus]|uniref:hypothetical protein n=1 Tax=Anaerovibrio lipolyticus TaxID=82374 RepID=UPI0023F1032B|nr:hypothetical protein [Anaerovibrio lipolyticus]
MNEIIKFEKVKDNAMPTEVVYVTIKEFGKLINMKEYSVRSLTMIDEFPCIKIGKKTLILRDKAKAWLLNNTHGAGKSCFPSFNEYSA